MSTKKKITTNDVTPEMLRSAKNIVRHVVALQSTPADPVLGLKIIATIVNLDPKKRVSQEQLPAGTTWKITPAQEWDHLARERRNVLD